MGGKTLWTIPASRFKTGHEQVVPLTPQVVKMLADIPQVDGRDRFFVTSDLLGSVAALKKAGVDNVRPKDLQRTARTRLAAIGVTHDVAERVQGHAIPGISRVYNHHEFITEKLEALSRLSQEWDAVADGVWRSSPHRPYGHKLIAEKPETQAAQNRSR